MALSKEHGRAARLVSFRKAAKKHPHDLGRFLLKFAPEGGAIHECRGNSIDALRCSLLRAIYKFQEVRATHIVMEAIHPQTGQKVRLGEVTLS